ncbi:MAG: class I SAM-dependent methyltransferase [Oscillospiraceae bacterium]|nr:class I SAM-dependent methyltransferase [Oscillospiraceae bacterium]
MYTHFADVYDMLMADVPYKDIAALYRQLIRQYCPGGKVLCDLACGTGTLTRLLAPGFDSVTGTDISPEMLNVAWNKGNDGIAFVQQDMRELYLPYAANVITCTLDGLCHLDSLADISMTFSAAAENLAQGGLFIFDMNTPLKHRELLSGETFVYDMEDVYCVWQNSECYGEDSRVDMCLDIFARDGDVWERSTEELSEIAFEQGVITSLLERAGFKVCACCDGFTDRAADGDSLRITYAARLSENRV